MCCCSKGSHAILRGHLVNDDCGLPTVPILNNFHLVKYLPGVEPLYAEVIEYEQVGL